MSYEEIEGGYIVKTEGDIITVIPPNESNADYQRYLRWLNGEDEDGTLS